ncbi:uncharacterized protein LOC109816765 [Cajanus cajan]|uniref:uncharacterized protein LOC109816765 n=1 Tax=Cajanus cajan TaxID=3821 RepID=UPI00098DC960|nr:uncharacterized protein LOC109816765 [Cajanus cajan]
MTLNATRGRFARVCVEIDLDQPVVGKVWFQNNWFKIQYEGLHLLCGECGWYGHVTRACPSSPSSSFGADKQGPSSSPSEGAGGGGLAAPGQEESNPSTITNPVIFGNKMHGDWYFFSICSIIDLKILAWNVRGASGRCNQLHIRDCVLRGQPDLVFLFEVHTLFNTYQGFWDRLGYQVVAIPEARGHSRGIWALWKIGNTVQCQSFAMTSQAVSVSIKTSGQSWICMGVYASPSSPARREMWHQLNMLRETSQSAWLLIGDFNDIMVASEQRGGTFDISRADIFAQQLESCGLLDLNLMGAKFTWHRRRNGLSLHKRLDRAVCDILWRTKFPEAVVEVLPRGHSDHNP